MGERTGIGWCHHTFNPWWGCVEVSPACDHCYARELAKRYGRPVWGKDAPRRFFGDKHWEEPFRWNWKAQEAGERHRVFCASMADVGEERDAALGRQLDQARQRLWVTIANTGWLDWLLLTKRPAGLRRVLPPEIAALPNVWTGVTVESSDYAWRIGELAKLDCAGPRWISYEPALSALNLTPWLSSVHVERPRLAWVLAGGESGGPPERALVHKCCIKGNCIGIGMHCPCAGTGYAPTPEGLAWMRSIRDQCQATGTAFFFKQWGGPTTKSAGRLLDGREWNEYPPSAST